MDPQQYDCIIFDFDGVILDSMAVRDEGFKKVLENFGDDRISHLLKYHRENAGLSRYHKFRYFYEKILDESVTEEIINDLAERFSIIMKGILIDKNLLIQDSISFIKKYHERISLYIASGSDQEELRYLCQKLGIDKYFNKIYGSPTVKSDLIKKIIEENKHKAKKAVMIGDAYNDKDAAEVNGVIFWGYNNEDLRDDGVLYINSLKAL
ncbi:MAG: haloacid dehalogenase [Candidatus Vogelbacteria bacterium CG10_big_fil_rev_8_21_14_0_10_51_16]|uniref:Haloacid dehalogenase n=1 Tax=Candidatus Vogelbacteria bacterium CG10_big_fil_rev_8_21_14_0_10_51_16 TaxID=1975045 RepID=A0A2H0REN4_9BACT|nr:MAG: haloacid dehalogenase [Candidatus Vogelbacteria bacterium CG10_big_fil_rev_8_21_14_0_10_51_16]